MAQTAALAVTVLGILTFLLLTGISVVMLKSVLAPEEESDEEPETPPESPREPSA